MYLPCTYWYVTNITARHIDIPYSGFCLRDPNFVWIMRAVTGSKILILQLGTLVFSFQLTARVTVPCLWFLYPIYVSVQILQKLEWTFLLCCLTQKAMVVCITCMMILQHFSNVANFPKHPCRCSILWSQSL